MVPLVCFTSKIHHQLKNGFVTMDKNLDETTEDDGICFYLHSNQLADDQPILLFPSGMEKLIWALPKVYEFYDSEVWAKAAAKSDGVKAVDDKVIFSVNIATTPQELQTNLEISVYKGKMYIYLKNYSWADDEGIWRPCRGTLPLDRYQDDPNALLSFALSTIPTTMHPLFQNNQE